ncbi:MAG: AAA family ATPase [Terriglobia bacterium]|jgi:putative ATP-dependent endonuclease of OLD family
MYLSRLDVGGFRGISTLSVEFQEGVNILIGENNTCKTAILDSIRLCLGFGSERRDMYVQAEDFFVGPDGKRAEAIEIGLTFAKPSQREQGIFVEMLSLTEGGLPVICLHVRYTYDGDHIRRRAWGGAKEGQEVPWALFELLSYTHLEALRNATRDLSPSRGNRLSRLFLKLVAAADEREGYASSINKQLKGMHQWRELRGKASDKIGEHLKEMVLTGQTRNVSIEFVDATFREIVEGLRMYIPRRESGAQGEQVEGGVLVGDRFQISQNSLGFNNLLYIATVLGDLLERREREPDAFISILIEEPEAHLHPHWQNTLFRYLHSIRSKGVQVFITSHSPTITAKSAVDSLVVMAGCSGKIVGTPIRQIGLEDAKKRHLQRFLDVTKSQLFFARGVILVEGISEALLMPWFASAMGPQFDLDRNGVEVVNIGGVAFEPFALLFNSKDGSKRLNTPCSILTDDDCGGDGLPSSRAANVLSLAGGNLRVYLARRTFEFELYLANEELTKEAYRGLHPDTPPSAGNPETRAMSFVEHLRSNKDKAVLAQCLAEKLSDAGSLEGLSVPVYIQRAIKWAVLRDETQPQ